MFIPCPTSIPASGVQDLAKYLCLWKISGILLDTNQAMLYIRKRASGMMYSKHNDHSLVLNKSGNTMIIRLKVMFELSLDLHG